MRFKTFIQIRIVRSDFGGDVLEITRLNTSRSSRWLMGLLTKSSQKRVEYLLSMCSFEVHYGKLLWGRRENWSPEYQEYANRHAEHFGLNHPALLDYHDFKRDFDVLEARFLDLEKSLPNATWEEQREHSRLAQQLAI